MLLVYDSQFEDVIPILYSEFHQSDSLTTKELESNRPTERVRIPFCTEGHVLNHLDDAEAVTRRFFLTWKYEMGASAIHADIDLIDLYLPNLLDSRTQMVLD